MESGTVFRHTSAIILGRKNNGRIYGMTFLNCIQTEMRCIIWGH